MIMNHPSRIDIASRLTTVRLASAAEQHEFLDGYRHYLMLLARVGTDQALRSKVSDSDVVQETLIQAVRDFNQFRGHSEAELTHWLRAIMSSKKAQLARRFYGTRARDPNLEVRLQDELDKSAHAINQVLVDRRSTPSQHYARRERAVLLAEALAQLPEDYREVVLLRHIEGRKMKEVAEKMNRTVDSVNKLWTRAMIQLRTSMKGLVDEQ